MAKTIDNRRRPWYYKDNKTRAQARKEWKMKIDSYEIFNNELLDAYNTDDTYYFADDGEYSSYYIEIDRRNKYRADDKIYIFDENNDTEITDGGLSCFISRNNRDIYNQIVDIINNYIKLKNI